MKYEQVVPGLGEVNWHGLFCAYLILEINKRRRVSGSQYNQQQ